MGAGIVGCRLGGGVGGGIVGCRLREGGVRVTVVTLDPLLLFIGVMSATTDIINN